MAKQALLGGRTQEVCALRPRVFPLLSSCLRPLASSREAHSTPDFCRYAMAVGFSSSAASRGSLSGASVMSRTPTVRMVRLLFAC